MSRAPGTSVYLSFSSNSKGGSQASSGGHAAGFASFALSWVAHGGRSAAVGPRTKLPSRASTGILTHSSNSVTRSISAQKVLRLILCKHIVQAYKWLIVAAKNESSIAELLADSAIRYMPLAKTAEAERLMVE